jgi:hypothetical protein
LIADAISAGVPVGLKKLSKDVPGPAVKETLADTCPI